jgi:lambda family phage minor tail protein L
MASQIVIEEKNKLGTDSVFMILLEITIPGTPIVYITNNGDNVTWRGHEWLAFPFEISELNENSTGEVPQWTISLDNRQRVMEKYLTDYDYYLKINGIEGNEIICNCYVVNSKDLANTEAIKEVYFELNNPSTTHEVATFTLTANSPFGITIPKRKYLKQFCFWKFKGIECCGSLPCTNPLLAAGTTCDKSLLQCESYNNSGRFGGWPSVGLGGVRL